MFIPINVLVYASLTVLFIVWFVYVIVLDRPAYPHPWNIGQYESGQMSVTGFISIILYIMISAIWGLLNNWF